jgi:gamma-glutamylcyclotransferase (GGCT)/AIG2-like uncharacterized protein YtfP
LASRQLPESQHWRITYYSFHKQSDDGSAKCNIAYVTERDLSVLGVVFDLPESEKPALDRFEGVGQGYEVRTMTVTLVGGQDIKVFTYWATKIDPRLKPYHWYKHHVLHGARTAGCPITISRELKQ